MKKSRHARQRRPSIVESLESRLTPGGITPHVIAIDRVPDLPDHTAAGSVKYQVTFDQAVSGVDASDFQIFTSGDAKVGEFSVVATSNNKVFEVTIAGLQGNGDIRLDLINDNSIRFTGIPIAGSFVGEVYHVLQTGPKVTQITADNPSTNSRSSVSWTVEFSEAVTGVDASDFALALTGPSTDALTVTPIAGSNGTRYTVTAPNISGAGTIGLDLVDNGSIRDADHNPLQTIPASLGSVNSYSSGSAAVAIVSADLDGDGDADLVLANYGYGYSSAGAGVTVLLGNGDGTFTQGGNFGVPGFKPSSLAVGDFNGDGAPDLVAGGFGFTSAGIARATVLLGNGQGGFDSGRVVDLGIGGRAVGVADLDGDGKHDIVVSSYVSGLGQVNVLRGNGNGTFQPAVSYTVGREPDALAIGDLNGDGRPDVVTANMFDNTVSVLLGTGGAALGAQTTFATGSNPTSVALGDLDGDGALDLAVANNSDGTVSVLLGNGSGGFSAKTDHDAGSLNPSGVAITDVDGDGKLDLVAVTGFVGGGVGIPSENLVSEGAPVSVLINQGGGTFGTAQIFPSNVYSLSSLTIGDFNGDGKPDVAGATAFGTADVLLNNGTAAAKGPAYTIVEAIADLSVTVSDGVATATTGDTLTYTFSYSNLGTVDATGVTLTAQLDYNQYFLPDENPGWIRSGGIVMKTITGSVNAGAMGTETLKLHVVEVLTGFSSGLALTATISDDGTHGSDINPGDNTASDYDELGGDQYGGYVVTAPGVAPARKFAPPVVRVFDRISGEELFTIDAYEAGYRDSIRVAVGDFNGDGVDDIVTTTQRGTGRLRVFDGRTGHQFQDGPLSEEFAVFDGRHDRGAFVAVGDVNGYGLPEIVVGSALGGGKVRVYSLDNSRDAAPEQFRFEALEKIADFKPFGAHFRGGVRVAVGDVNFFGQEPTAAPENGESSFRLADDIIVGQGFFGGKVRVYDGALLSDGLTPNESLIKEFKVGGRGYKGGVSVGVGYVDDDPFIDIVVGRNYGKPSVVEVFSGRDFTPLGPAIDPFDENPQRPEYHFGVRVATADVNGDGVADIIASVGIKKNSFVKFYDGAALRDGRVEEIEGRTFVAYSDFPNVALWVAGSTSSSMNV